MLIWRMLLRGLIPFSLLIISAPLGAEPLPPQRPADFVIPEPFAPDAYAPSLPLPPGVLPMRVEVRDGQRWECRAAASDRAPCSLVPGLFAAWRAESSSTTHALSIEVIALAPRPKTVRSDTEWAKQLWIETHGASQWRQAQLRTFTGPAGRIAESQVQWGGREVDPAWALTRFEERRGFVLYLRMVVAGVPSAAERAALRRSFVEGPLGSRP